MLLSGCCCLNKLETQKPVSISPIKEAEFFLGEKRTETAIKILKNTLKSNGHRCQAAFYLLFLDGDKKEYRGILEEQSCKSRYFYNQKILQAYIKEKERYKKCRQALRTLRRQKKKCIAEKVRLQKEKDQVSFELKKLEQIRRETERLRLKKID